MSKEKIKKTKSSANKAINIIIAVVLVAVIALSAVALYDKFRPRDKVKDVAEDMGMQVEQFMEEYGLEGVSPDAKFEEAYNNMTVENALKLYGTTFEEFATSNGLPETVTPDMTVSEVNSIMEEMYAAEESAEPAEAAAE